MSGVVTFTSLQNPSDTTIINGGALTTCNLYASNIYAATNDPSTYAQMTSAGYSVIVNAYQKAFLGMNPNYIDSNGCGAPALILGTDMPAYVEKFWNGSHCMWIGNGGMSCGIMFNFTTNTFTFYGTQV